MGFLHFPITGDNSGFMAALHQVTQGVRDASSQIQAEGGAIDAVFSRLREGLGILGVGWGFKELISQTASTRSEFQKLEIAFKTFLGSEEKANALMNQMVETAAKTPFDLKGVAESAKGLLAFGIQAEEVNRIIVSLGDVAAGLSQPLSEIVYLYGTTVTKPKMDTMDLKQHLGRGIPIARELAKELKVAESEVADLVSQGKVTGEIYKKAFDNLTGEGSMFGGLMEAQSKSIQGQIDNIADSVDSMFNEIGKSTEPIFNSVLETTSNIVDHWREVLQIVGDIAVAYGSQKAWLALDAGFTKAATNYGYEAEMTQLRALLPVKEEEKLSTLEQAVAAGTLTEAKAAEIQALRDEAKSQLDTLVKKEEIAKAEEAIAMAKSKAADDEVEAIEKEIEATWDRITAGMASMTAEEAEEAVTELDTLETMRNEAANIAQAASEELRAASTNVATAAQERETLATGIDTAQNTANTASVGILTIAKEKLALAMAKVNAIMAANKYAIIIGLVIALGYAIYKLITYENDHEKAIREATEAANQQEASMRKELSTLDDLKKKLDNARQGTEEWKSIKDQIVSQFGGYLSGLDAEIIKTGSLATSYKKLADAIRLSAAARAMDAYRKEHEGDLTKDLDDVLEDSQMKLNGTFLKRDRNGNVVKDKNGKLIQIKLSEDEKERYQQDIYNYATTGNLDRVDAMEKAYLQSAGIISSQSRQGRASKHVDKRKSLWEGERVIAKKYGTTVEKVDGTNDQTDNTQKSENLQTTYSEASKRYKDAKNKKNTIAKNRSKYTKKDWEDAVEEEKAAKESFEKYGGDTKTGTKKTTPRKTTSGPTPEQIAAKEENAAGKLADLIRKQGEERLQIEEDYEYQRWQTRINLMEDGEKKILAQMQLDQAKERTELKRRQKSEEEAELQRQIAVFNAKEDEKAAGNKKYAKKTFRDSDIDQAEFKKIEERYKLLYEDLDAMQQKSEDDRLKGARESMNAYLKEMGSYEEKRKAIEAEYSDKIVKAPNSGERKLAMAQRNQALANLDFEEWQKGGGLADAFGDVSRMSQDMVRSLIKDMEQYRSKIVATFDPDKIAKFEEALNNLRMADVEMDFDFWGTNEITEGFRERLAIQRQITEEAKNQEELERQQRELLKEADPSLIMGIDPNGRPIINEAILSEEDGKRAEELRVKLDAIRNALEQSAKNTKKLESELKKLKTLDYADIKKLSSDLKKAGDNAAKFAGIFSDGVADAIKDGTDVMETMVDSVETIAQSFEALTKKAEDTVEKTVDAAEKLTEGAAEGMKATGASVSTSLSTMEKASAILAIIGAAIQLATIMVSLFSKDKKHEKRIKELQNQIDDLETSYDRLGRAIDNAYSTDASELIAQQDDLLEQQKELIEQQKVEEEAKKKTDKDKLRDYDNQLRKIDETLEDNRAKAKEAIIGEDIKSAINEFASAYANAWEEGTKAASASTKAVKSIVTSALNELLKKQIQPTTEALYDALSEYMKDGILEESELKELDQLKAEIDKIAAKEEEQYRKLQERYRTLEEIQEDLTDTTFDSVRDNFKELLSDMESSTADFSDSFTSMLRNALIEGLMSAKYDKMLEEWYAEFAEKMEDRNLTDEERDYLRQKYQAIVDAGLEDRNAINEIVGQGAFAQSASEGGFAAMGQDTADELNGRFTAMVELQAASNTMLNDSNAIGREILAAINSFNNISQVATGDNSTLMEIKDMMFLSTGYLEDIAKYSKRLASIDSGINDMKTTLNNKL